MKTVLTMGLGLLALMTVQNAAADEGKVLHNESCTECHASRLGFDDNAIYTRDDRRMSNYHSLRQMVARCNNQTGAGWFDEEEQLVTDYLNRAFYKFPAK
ncbi:hypothetical protein [Magnetococcus sp. PR-3]|uniref:hypothetical protein n=1 Tax=Magnetococcus sp. PR-3 TaxID=3120355 RepID=UPI002FCE3EA0